MNINGDRIEGPIEAAKLKLVSIKGGKLTISNILHKSDNINNKITYIVNINIFGSKVFELSESDLKRFILSPRASTEKHNLDSNS